MTGAILDGKQVVVRSPPLKTLPSEWVRDKSNVDTDTETKVPTKHAHTASHPRNFELQTLETDAICSFSCFSFSVGATLLYSSAYTRHASLYYQPYLTLSQPYSHPLPPALPAQGVLWADREEAQLDALLVQSTF